MPFHHLDEVVFFFPFFSLCFLPEPEPRSESGSGSGSGSEASVRWFCAFVTYLRVVGCHLIPAPSPTPSPPIPFVRLCVRSFGWVHVRVPVV